MRATGSTLQLLKGDADFRSPSTHALRGREDTCGIAAKSTILLPRYYHVALGPDLEIPTSTCATFQGRPNALKVRGFRLGIV